MVLPVPVARPAPAAAPACWAMARARCCASVVPGLPPGARPAACCPAHGPPPAMAGLPSARVAARGGRDAAGGTAPAPARARRRPGPGLLRLLGHGPPRPLASALPLPDPARARCAASALSLGADPRRPLPRCCASPPAPADCWAMRPRPPCPRPWPGLAAAAPARPLGPPGGDETQREAPAPADCWAMAPAPRRGAARACPVAPRGGGVVVGLSWAVAPLWCRWSVGKGERPARGLPAAPGHRPVGVGRGAGALGPLWGAQRPRWGRGGAWNRPQGGRKRPQTTPKPRFPPSPPKGDTTA